MKAFLYNTAKEILNKYKDDILLYCFVFPNKRTKFYFRKHYAEIYGTSSKAPDMREIRILTQNFTNLSELDNLNLIFILYKIFKEVEGKNKYNFDSFYRLGEIILSDFNEVDNWLIDPEQIFQNIKDIKEIDAQFDWLTEEQKEMLKSFWVNFSPENYSEEQKMFIELWNILPKIYKRFTEKLLANKTVYGGLKNRELSKLIDKEKINTEKYKKYLFIGFNALNKGEIKLFKHLKKINKAEFYWDTDKYYQNDKKQEAGDFLRKNFKELQISSKNLPSNLLKNKKIDLIGVPLNVGQAKIIPSLLKNIDIKNEAENTAIVLADEHLLFPTLSSLPEEIKTINVTMGYPFKMTPLFGIIKQYTALHTSSNIGGASFYHKNIINILRHPFVKNLETELTNQTITEIEQSNTIYVQSKNLISHNSELFKLLFSRIPEKDALDIFLSNILNLLFMMFDKSKDEEENTVKTLENEYIHKTYVKTKQIRETFRNNDVDVGLKLGSEILMQILRQEQIPFEGNAVEGIQLMGVLESRNLDFKNLVILGMNEGNMPAVSKKPTFISQSMRFAFEMPMIKYQDAVYAYLFYSLIQRAENISLVYNSIVNDGNSGELSRFILQLKNETDLSINEYHFNQTLSLKKKKEITIEKDPEVRQILKEFILENNSAKRKFSPAAINLYIDCSLRFYFKYIANFKEQNAVEEEFSQSAFGQILHKALENIYSDIKKEKNTNIIEKADIKKIYKKIPSYVNTAFKSIYGKTENYKITGSQIIIQKVISNYVSTVLKKDESYTTFEIISVEDKDKFISDIEIITDGNKQKVRISGIIDRIDKKDGVYRVIDYKTGTQRNKFNSIEELFNSEKTNRAKHVLQTFIYLLTFKNSNIESNLKIKPAIFYVRNMKNKDYSSSIFMKKNEMDEILTNELLPEFKDKLQQTLSEIFSPELPFEQTKNKKNCEFCSFYDLCY